MQSETIKSSLPTSVTPTQLQELLASRACSLIDVREPVEHREEHHVEAQLIPLGQLAEGVKGMDRDRPLVLMCRSGKRGSTACEQLRAMGFKHISNLDGGILALKQAGFPLVKGSGKHLPLMQQVQIVIGSGVLAGVILGLTIHPYYSLIAGFFGAGLIFAGSTGYCGLAMLLARMPWNTEKGKTSSCSTGCCSDS